MPGIIVLMLVFATATQSGEPDAVRAFFDEFVARSNAFDPSIAELYSPDARVMTLRDGSERLEMSGREWTARVGSTMPLARRRGDRSGFEDIVVTGRDDGYRVTATRIPAVKCVPDINYHVDVAKRDGKWLIVEEYSETVSLSRCEPSGQLATALAKLAKGVRARLPLDLDADTRLESIDVAGPALIYTNRLHTIAAAELDADVLRAELGKYGIRNVCDVAAMKALVDDGATVRYAFIDREGTQLANVDIWPGLCP